MKYYTLALISLTCLLQPLIACQPAKFELIEPKTKEEQPTDPEGFTPTTTSSEEFSIDGPSSANTEQQVVFKATGCPSDTVVKWQVKDHGKTGEGALFSIIFKSPGEYMVIAMCNTQKLSKAIQIKSSKPEEPDNQGQY